ncbi:NAD(P)H-dependent oxidoreductase [Acuticoccus mangrovi]|uniref:NAD(P)H-dependent oxidoreductase n=1 Tax=Acuticoccus mangrovi TaxID=2796142 RepID=A0A934MJ59_9HYPH|nr:NAD(P)H-dependent oxidoreductase [Acuticoccus mangrovi]MBJ3777926.1 NAD(P)H-dependent oxidoreductase [Acuticoccus mangrovi]
MGCGGLRFAAPAAAVNLLLVNGHHPYSGAKGALADAFLARARALARARGDAVRETHVATDWAIDEEVDRHVWADAVLYHYPVYTMSVPWRTKRYLDEIFTAGMDGRMSKGDGRSRRDPTAEYGMAGVLTGTRYMLCVTFNAPAAAFDDPAKPFFQGMSVDDLMRPVHLAMKFVGMRPLPSFAAFDVHKNPDTAGDLARFERHIEEHLVPA